MKRYAAITIFILVLGCSILFGKGDEGEFQLSFKGEYQVVDGQLWVSLFNLSESEVVIQVPYFTFRCEVQLKEEFQGHFVSLDLPEYGGPIPGSSFNYSVLPKYAERTAGPPRRITHRFPFPREYSEEELATIKSVKLEFTGKAILPDSKLTEVSQGMKSFTVVLEKSATK